jgi:PadR family transcriptional regulator, regulatory protein AphA
VGRRILKYAILGLLSKRDMSGYDITNEFKQAIGQFWSAKHSQIYVELKKLLEEEAISQYVEMAGAKLEKKMYRLTSNGESELHEWLVKPDEKVETEKDVFALRLYFLKDIAKDEISPLFDYQLSMKYEKIEYLKEQLEILFGETSDPVKLDTASLGHYLVLTKAIAREESYAQWLEDSLTLITQHHFHKGETD